MKFPAKSPQTRSGEGSEGGHWYSPGPPVTCEYEILGANGKYRPVTLRDARKFGWYPGVTSILRAAAAPGLERWKVRQAIMAALTHPEAHKIVDIDELMKVLEQDSKEEARKAAEKGTKIHAAVEDFYKTGNVDTDYAEYITGVRKLLHQLTGVDDPTAWETEVAACHPYGFGSRIDLLSRELDIIVDFKGKEFGPKEHPKGFTDQGRQLAAYKHLANMPTARIVNVYISRNHPGVVSPFEWNESDHDSLWNSFVWLLGFWQIDKGMPLLAKVSEKAA